ncbi:hypothetical protein [Prochlorococcus sp. MIT 1341]|uniref:hypothetical protein n=1 Tax=Prochlorococcus sp. MIT 1341 TaxID=3096221 RepID=UPI002A74C094|nr:hypothetical protein [Prochlorococcus sp. MIT 1341]
MPYSETSVLVGAFVHVPIIIGLFFVLNNFTKKRSNYTEDTESELKDETVKRLSNENKSQSIGIGLLEEQNISNPDSDNKKQVNNEKQKEKAEAERRSIEAKKRTEIESLAADAERLTTEIKQKIEADRLAEESNQKVSRETDLIADQADEENDIETRLKVEVERLEAEAEFLRKTSQSELKDSSNSDNMLNAKKTPRFNPWQIAAIGVLAIGGTTIFFSNSSPEKDDALNQSSSIRHFLVERS